MKRAGTRNIIFFFLLGLTRLFTRATHEQTSFFYPWAETTAHHMNKTHSFITDISEYFVTGLEKLTLCSTGGIHFLYITQTTRNKSQFIAVDLPPNISRYIYKTNICKGLLEPLNCVPYSFIYSSYTWTNFVLLSETGTTVALQFRAYFIT